MSVIVVKMKNEKNTLLLTKFIGIINEEARVISEEEYRDSMLAKLLEEGRKSKLLSPAQAKKEFKKRGIKI